jgi:hypothetical protein
MPESTPSTLSPSDASESLVRPGANVSFFGWLLLLGLPLVLLFLIYSKQEQQLAPTSQIPVIELQNPAH